MLDLIIQLVLTPPVFLCYFIYYGFHRLFRSRFWHVTTSFCAKCIRACINSFREGGMMNRMGAWIARIGTSFQNGCYKISFSKMKECESLLLAYITVFAASEDYVIGSILIIPATCSYFCAKFGPKAMDKIVGWMSGLWRWIRRIRSTLEKMVVFDLRADSRTVLSIALATNKGVSDGWVAYRMCLNVDGKMLGYMLRMSYQALNCLIDAGDRELYHEFWDSMLSTCRLIFMEVGSKVWYTSVEELQAMVSVLVKADDITKKVKLSLKDLTKDFFYSAAFSIVYLIAEYHKIPIRDDATPGKTGGFRLLGFFKRITTENLAKAGIGFVPQVDPVGATPEERAACERVKQEFPEGDVNKEAKIAAYVKDVNEFTSKSEKEPEVVEKQPEVSKEEEVVEAVSIKEAVSVSVSEDKGKEPEVVAVPIVAQERPKNKEEEISAHKVVANALSGPYVRGAEEDLDVFAQRVRDMVVKKLQDAHKEGKPLQREPETSQKPVRSKDKSSEQGSTTKKIANALTAGKKVPAEKDAKLSLKQPDALNQPHFFPAFSIKHIRHCASCAAAKEKDNFVIFIKFLVNLIQPAVDIVLKKDMKHGVILEAKASKATSWLLAENTQDHFSRRTRKAAVRNAVAARSNRDLSEVAALVRASYSPTTYSNLQELLGRIGGFIEKVIPPDAKWGDRLTKDEIVQKLTKFCLENAKDDKELLNLLCTTKFTNYVQSMSNAITQERAYALGNVLTILVGMDHAKVTDMEDWKKIKFISDDIKKRIEENTKALMAKGLVEVERQKEGTGANFSYCPGDEVTWYTVTCKYMGETDPPGQSGEGVCVLARPDASAGLESKITKVITVLAHVVYGQDRRQTPEIITVTDRKTNAKIVLNGPRGDFKVIPNADDEDMAIIESAKFGSLKPSKIAIEGAKNRKGWILGPRGWDCLWIDDVPKAFNHCTGSWDYSTEGPGSSGRPIWVRDNDTWAVAMFHCDWNPDTKTNGAVGAVALGNLRSPPVSSGVVN